MSRAFALVLIAMSGALGCKRTAESAEPAGSQRTANAEASEQPFWWIVDGAAREAGRGDPVEPLRRRLTELPAEQVLDFHRALLNQLARSHSWNLWGAAYIINGGCSDDCFEYFRGWLVMQGHRPTLGEGWNFDDRALMKQKYPKLCARFAC